MGNWRWRQNKVILYKYCHSNKICTPESSLKKSFTWRAAVEPRIEWSWLTLFQPFHLHSSALITIMQMLFLFWHLFLRPPMKAFCVAHQMPEGSIGLTEVWESFNDAKKRNSSTKTQSNDDISLPKDYFPWKLKRTSVIYVASIRLKSSCWEQPSVFRASLHISQDKGRPLNPSYRRSAVT